MATAVTRRLPEIRSLGLTAGVAVAATAVFLLVSRALIDDAYITMAYARNLAFHLHWGMIADETANSATSPLNVIALGAITAVVRDGVVAVGVLFVGSAVLAAHWLAELAADTGLHRALPAVAVGTLLVNPLLLSTVGLEPYLTAALLAGLLRYGVARRPVAFGVLAGLCVLARPDTAVVVVVVALVLRPAWLRAIGAALAVTLPWYVFSWFALGSALPDTLLMKANDAWDVFGFWNGPLLYLLKFPAATALSFLPVLAGLAALVGLLVVRPREAVGAGRHRGRPWRGRPLRRLLPAAHRALPLVLRPVDHRDDVLRGDRRRPRAVGGGGGRRAGLRRAGGRPAARRAVDPRRDLDELGHGRRVRADGHGPATGSSARPRSRAPARSARWRTTATARSSTPSPTAAASSPPSRPASRRAGSARPSCGSTTCTSTATRRPGPSSTGCATRRTSRPRGPSSGRVDHWVDGPGRIVLER